MESAYTTFDLKLYIVINHFSNNWKRHHLIYRKNDHSEWAGMDSCRFLMSTIVEEAKKGKFE